jgi:hypothetical protein
MSNNFTTLHEKQFIDMLSFNNLIKYIDCLNKRVNWGMIDKSRVRRHAEKRLFKIRRRF